jgi:hypothetical protein
MTRPFHESFQLRRAVDHGWAAFKAAPGPLLVGAILMQCSEGGGGGTGNWGSALQNQRSEGSGQGGSSSLAPRLLEASRDLAHRTRADVGDFVGDLSESLGNQEAGVIAVIVVAAVLLGLLCIGVLLAFRCWIEPGWYRLQREVLSSGSGRFGTLFGAWDAFLSLLGWKVLAGLISVGTFLLAAIPGGALLAWGLLKEILPVTISGGLLLAILVIPALWYVGLGLWFGPRLVALERARAIEALERSWELARGHRWQLFWFNLVLVLLQVSGICLFCVGILVTRPVAETGATGAFLLYVRPREETDAYWCRRTRPDRDEPFLPPAPPPVPEGVPG